MRNADSTKKSYSKMSSVALLKIAENGKLNHSDAKILAEIIEKRFPTPQIKKGTSSIVIGIHRKEKRVAYA